MRAVLGYFIIFLFLLLTELVFNLLGWIPQVGFSFMGLAININSIASLLLLFVLVILVFAKLIMAPHVVYNQDFRSNIDGSINFLGTIGKRFLRYTLSSIPTIFFGFIVIIIPALIVGLSILLTYNIKNTILDTRIDLLNDRLTVLEGVDYYKASKDIEALKLYKAYPFNFVNEFSGLKSLTKEIQHLDANIKKGEEEINRLSMEYYAASDSLDKKIERTRVAAMADSSLTGELNNLQDQRISRQESFKTWTDESNLGVGKMKVDMSQRKGMRIQLPIVFLLTIIWASLFLGIVVAFFVSYLGNVYFELYNYREDGTPSYFCQLLTDIREKDKNQPLLGFTLLFLLGPIVIYFTVILNFVTGLLS